MLSSRMQGTGVRSATALYGGRGLGVLVRATRVGWQGSTGTRSRATMQKVRGDARALGDGDCQVTARPDRLLPLQTTPVSKSYASALVEAAQSGAYWRRAMLYLAMLFTPGATHGSPVGVAWNAEGQLEDVAADVETLKAYMEAQPDVAEFFNNPGHRMDKKTEVFNRLAHVAGLNKVTQNFVNVLFQKGRESQLSNVLYDFDDIYCEASGTVKATVKSAIELSEDQQYSIARKIKDLTGAKNVKLQPQVDSSLLGGFVVQYGRDGSGFIDMSIRGSLEGLSHQLSSSSL